MIARYGVAALCLVIAAWTAVMSAFEPVLLDGWFIEQWHRGVGEFVCANWNGDVTWGNPRFGQWITVLTYERGFHVVFTPILVVVLFLLMLAHLRGRWPVRGDAWALLVLAGVTVLAQPQLGPLLFYRPFTANYVLGLVVQLAWMLPYRFALAGESSGACLARSSVARAVGMAVLGLAAGACNEHTGPVLVVGVAIAIGWFARRGRLRVWMIAGGLALLAGYLAMMTAPAQAVRYCGVAEGGVVDRIVDRGLVNNLKVAGAIAFGGKWAWLALGIVAIAARTRVRAALRSPARVWIALGIAMTLTLLASPKQGDRLLFAGLVFATIGIVALLDQLAERRVRTAIAIGAGLALAVAIVVSSAIQIRSAHDVEARRELLAAARGQHAITVPPLRHGPSRWFLGDDLPSDALRDVVAQLYGLDEVELAGHPAVSFRLEIRYRLGDGAEQVYPQRMPLHLCEARRRLVAAVGALLLAHGPALQEVTLAVIPRDRTSEAIAAARWRDGTLVSPGATVVNEGHTRWITLDRGGLPDSVEVRIVGPDRSVTLVRDGGRYPYRPWRNGTFWVVACAGRECYLADLVRHTQV